MQKILRKYSSHDEMKAEEFRYWQSRPVHERMAAVSELSTFAYALKGEKRQDVQGLQGPVVRISLPKR